MHGPNQGAFGHMGAGGQIGFADPTDGVAVGFIRNHLENQALPLMGACLVDVLYSCLAKGGAGGQIGFADPVTRVGCGFVRNHLENQAFPLMGACLVDVLYSCLGEGGVGVRS